MPARIKKKNILSIDEICSKICQIFDQAQHSATSHKKNVVELYKCHAEMASMKFSEGNRLSGETKFLEIVSELLSRIFLLKRTEKSAENIVKLLGAYVKLINERAVEELRGREEDPVDDDYENVKDEDTLASRFTFGFCKFLLAGFRAKDKNVRFRVVQTCSAVVSHLGEIDEGLWKSIWKHLEDRLQDKDAAVRTQAALGLCKFAGGEDPDSEDIQVTLTLRNALSADDSAKNCYIFLKRNATQNNEMGPTHPRRITIAQRERIVCTGIGDREDSVVDAARDLIATWFDLAEEMPVKQEGPDKDEQASSNAKFLAFLSLFDLLVAPESAEKALLSVFETKPSETKLLTCKAHQMTPESAFLARVYIESLKRFKNEEDKMKKLDRLENYLPLVTDHLFPLQETFNDCFLYEYRNEEHRDMKEFFLEEMLKITTHLDYGDETGRRKTYDLIKAMLKENVPENILTGCMQVLPFITASERDLIRVVVEFIQDLRDPGDDIDAIAQEAEGDPDASFESTPSTPVRPNTQKSVQEKSTEDKVAINLKCLTMSVAMLEQVNDTINNNSSLNGLFKELILPTVKEPFDDISRDKAWTCLALICLIDQKLATIKTVEMFLQHSTTAPEELKIIILQGLFDILMVYQRAILSPENVRAVADSLIAKLEEETSAKAQEVICHGLAKLIMAGIFTDELIIVHLLMMYFSPETTSNQPLRQLLLHFFNLYSASSPANKRLVAEVFTDTLQELSNARNDTSTDVMVSPTLIIGHFMTWTNPYNFRVNQETVITEEHPLYCDAASIQFMMTIDIVKILLKDTLDKDDKKALCTNISKLHIPDNADGNALRTLKMLLFRLQSRQPVKDATAKNAINKFEIALSKKFESQLANFSEEEYRDLDELKELFTFLDELIPLDDEDEVIDVKPKRTRKRRSDSVTSLSSEDTETNSRKPKTKAKKRRISGSDDGSDFETERTEHTAPPATRTRSNPKRAAMPVFIDLTLDSDDETGSTPVPLKSMTRVKVETASAVDADINHLLEEEIEEIDTSSVVDDSLLGPADSDSEGEEDEVNDLLADDED
ncbi:nuclear condensing complex subunit [Desarmillaria tabescens]|uniref:Nuclear condensing complex subunit n=1 Tax=Armillaria tabescens TaxID=1929756 RepID=A0AA39KCW1_ARMTA|nr:nuclear condensing complex subunit [Desarmillaria tabescens]KAK0458800.1 nuclear condensing complex subunit [Desarmillaria tabescens]